MRQAKSFIFTLLFFGIASFCYVQETTSTVEPPRTADLSFHPPIDRPAYPLGKGPSVLIDEAHNNFHTADGTYKPFVSLIERDGYVVKRLKDKFTPERLYHTKILVIADAQPPAKKGDPSTFSEREIDVLNTWIREGGSLFLITDHMPDPAAIKELANSFGVEVNNGYVLNGYFQGRERPIVFKRSDKGLSESSVTNGRSSLEKISSIATFSGSAFKAGPEFQPVLILGPDKRSWMPKKLYEIHEDTPSTSVAGWYQGAVAKFGRGKIALFSEAAMFTAQIFDQGKVRVGMNHPLARDNAQLLLNVMHWLSGLL
ncbi:MAG: hypothetical protein PVI66_03030 [Candidatus Aminicenantes bacterium]